jgi:anti-anti-sigma factor
MLDITEYLISNEKIAKLEGRIDGVSSEEINIFIADFLDRGNRKVVLDFENVNYISSAGLRVFLINQKKITAAGGEILFYKLPNSIKEIFRLSGFLKLFKVIENESELIDENKSKSTPSIIKTEIENIKFEYSNISNSKSKIHNIGDTSQIEFADYTEKDLIKINAKEHKYVVGFGAIGDEWTAISQYFGESFILDGNMFVYPAIKRPAVDFMIFSEEMDNLEFGFLNGFELSGNQSDVVNFEMKDSFIDLTLLLDSISELLKCESYGFAIIGECKGLMGMNLKKVPITENKPMNKKGIFDSDNFSDWVNFPVEPDSSNTMIAGVGMFSKSEKKKNSEFKNILTGSAKFHLHCGIFERKLMSFNTENYAENLQVILHELQPLKVQHIMPGTMLSMGTLAIFKLED